MVLRTAAGLVLPFLLWVNFGAAVDYTIGAMDANKEAGGKQVPMVTALRLGDRTDEQGFPLAVSWNKVIAVRFDHDWKGQNSSPARATEVRVLWTPETLFLRFVANYQTLNVYSEARNDGWKDELWERDVAEAFLQPDSSDALKYKEIEVAPNGFWVDLDISHGERAELRSGLKRRVVLDEKEKTWTAELAIPLKALTPAFDARREWRVNFFRVEGGGEPRFYSTWSPTYSEKANFHVPEAFGRLVFRERE